MKVTIQGGSVPIGPIGQMSFAFGNGVTKHYRVTSYTQTTLYLGHRLEEYVLDTATATQEATPTENTLRRLQQIQELINSHNDSRMMRAKEQLADLISDLS
jgi:hypothetical protein